MNSHPGLTQAAMKASFPTILSIYFLLTSRNSLCGLFWQASVVIVVLFVASSALTLDLFFLHLRPLFTSELFAVTHPGHATGSDSDSTLGNSSLRCMFSSRASSLCSFFWTGIMLTRFSCSHFVAPTLASTLASNSSYVGSFTFLAASFSLVTSASLTSSSLVASLTCSKFSIPLVPSDSSCPIFPHYSVRRNWFSLLYTTADDRSCINNLMLLLRRQLELNYRAPFGPLPVTLSIAPARDPISQSPYTCVLAQVTILRSKLSKL